MSTISIPLIQRGKVNHDGPRKRVVRGGEKFTVRLDPLSHSRLCHAEHIARLVLDVETNHSGIIRTAIAFYLQHLDAQLKKFATISEDDEKSQRLLKDERMRLIEGTKEYTTPWKQYPSEQAAKVLLSDSQEWAAFGEIVRRYARRGLAI